MLIHACAHIYDGVVPRVVRKSLPTPPCTCYNVRERSVRFSCATFEYDWIWVAIAGNSAPRRSHVGRHVVGFRVKFTEIIYRTITIYLSSSVCAVLKSVWIHRGLRVAGPLSEAKRSTRLKRDYRRLPRTRWLPGKFPPDLNRNVPSLDSAGRTVFDR